MRDYPADLLPRRADDLRLAAEPSARRRSSASTRCATFNSGGAPCPVEVIEQFERTHRPARSTKATACRRPRRSRTRRRSSRVRKPGTIGLPVPDTDMKIVDLETGTRELPLGEAGELCIAGPQVMKGYWNRPDETAHAAHGRRRPHLVPHRRHRARSTRTASPTIVQRKKDMIIVDGFNVYPSEVEAVLYLASRRSPGGRHRRSPTRITARSCRACVALQAGRDGRPPTSSSRTARRSSPPYKVPQHIEIRDTLPMSAVGKILYRVLRDELVERGPSGRRSAGPDPMDQSDLTPCLTPPPLPGSSKSVAN